MIGGGLTGLACAQRLMGLGIEPLLLEASGRIGGKIRTVTDAGYEFEAGPNTLLASNPALLEMIDEIGLADQIIETAPSAKRRYVLHRGRLVPAPMNPLAAVTSPLLGPAGILGAIEDLWRRRPVDVPADETVASFIRRRFGQRVLENLVAPFLAGVYGGDAGQLEARSTLKRLVEAEEHSGSVIRGLLALRKRNKDAGDKPKKKRKSAHRSITFQGGLEALPRRVAQRLGPRVRVDMTVISMTEDSSGCQLVLAGGQVIHVGRVVIATETTAASQLVENLPDTTEIATDLRAIRSAGIAVVGFAFPRASVAHRLDGFGYLAGAGSTSPVLGCFFRSSIFPHTAPAGVALLVSFVGGARHDISALTNDQLLEMARQELDRRLGLTGSPQRVFFERWPEAIPQFTPGHAARVQRIADWSQRGRVSIVSSGVHGVALPLCVETGRREAERIAKKV